AKSVRPEIDFVARYGGEEFVIILPETDRKGALRVAERIRKNVSRINLPGAQALPLGLFSVSIGIAMLSDDVKDPAKFIKAADDALYNAKRAGKNRVILAGESESSWKK
ncbi:MAG: GGDEF domain-containing protein, partial [bacterium]